MAMDPENKDKSKATSSEYYRLVRNSTSSMFGVTTVYIKHTQAIPTDPRLNGAVSIHALNKFQFSEISRLLKEKNDGKEEEGRWILAGLTILSGISCLRALVKFYPTSRLSSPESIHRTSGSLKKDDLREPEPTSCEYYKNTTTLDALSEIQCDVINFVLNAKAKGEERGRWIIAGLVLNQPKGEMRFFVQLYPSLINSSKKETPPKLEPIISEYYFITNADCSARPVFGLSVDPRLKDTVMNALEKNQFEAIKNVLREKTDGKENGRWVLSSLIVPHGGEEIKFSIHLYPVAYTRVEDGEKGSN